ncbi:DUF1798 family protein [Macrococcoides caseolyticum]|uniref:DUF1798 family protein n=1 Tax=Macrococcoides caseolyticum TaxID=69966 RepID=UPI001F3CC784|nr:DUF1798 family protein [Macrococcus caseolyticus]MCE4957044.1 DUF1798 family protein [Macrococcus caseolyticus]
MLHNCIKSLITELQLIENYFERSKKGEYFNFVLDVQPFTERVDNNLMGLEQFTSEILSLPLMNEKKLLLLKQHLRELSVDCFFEKTSKKLFIDKYKAVQHDLTYIYRQIGMEDNKS